MITTKIEYYIKHGDITYLVSYDVNGGNTMLSVWQQDREMYVYRYDAPFICDDRKAAEIFCQAFIKHEDRKKIN